MSAEQDSIAINKLTILFFDEAKANNNLFILELDLILNTATILKSSEPLPWFGNPKAVYSPKWDYWLYGISKTIFIDGTAFEFKNSIGFIMSA